MKTISEEIQSKFKDERHKLMINLLFTGNYLKALETRAFASFGLSPQQFNILRILRGANDWLAMNDIKARMIDRSPNTTRLADKLLEKQLVERSQCDKDRRVVFLKVSSKGLKLLNEIDNSEELEKLNPTQHITEEEAKRMNDILDRLRQ